MSGGGDDECGAANPSDSPKRIETGTRVTPFEEMGERDLGVVRISNRKSDGCCERRENLGEKERFRRKAKDGR